MGWNHDFFLIFFFLCMACLSDVLAFRVAPYSDALFECTVSGK